MKSNPVIYGCVVKLVCVALACMQGCSWGVVAKRKAAPLPVIVEQKDGLTEILPDGRKIFARYFTYRSQAAEDSVINSLSAVKGHIVGREIEVYLEEPSGKNKMIASFKNDEELKHILLISRLKYNTEKELLAFTTEKVGIIFVISTKTGKCIKKILSANNPRWSADGSKLLYIGTQDSLEKEEFFLPSPQ